MSTLKELKDWLEQGGKICRESSQDLVYDLTEEDELRDQDDGVATYQSLIASDWKKVEDKVEAQSRTWTTNTDTFIIPHKEDHLDLVHKILTLEEKLAIALDALGQIAKFSRSEIDSLQAAGVIAEIEKVDNDVL